METPRRLVSGFELRGVKSVRNYALKLMYIMHVLRHVDCVAQMMHLICSKQLIVEIKTVNGLLRKKYEKRLIVNNGLVVPWYRTHVLLLVEFAKTTYL